MGLLIEECMLEGKRPGSVYIEGGTIVRISDSPTQTVPNGTPRVEANGGSLFAGFTDTHCHPFEYGWLKRNVDLRGTSNLTGLRMRLSSRVQRTPPGEWVTGMGWDQETFAEGRMPTRHDIDDIAPRNPVALMRVCGHVALLNSRAVETLAFEGRRGEEFERDGAGALTGIVKEGAVAEALARVPRSVQSCSQALQSVEVEAMRYGITRIHCIVSPEGFVQELDALGQLQTEGSLSINYRVYIPPEALTFVEDRGLRGKLAGDRVRIMGVKVYADGSLGASTAALREPYADDPSNTGILRHTDAELSEIVDRADRAGLQVIVHAIGDRAVEQAVGALSRVTGAKNPRRHRIEHASLLPRDLRNQMARHAIRATVQPLFITSDTWALKRLGEERVHDLYPLRSMMADGITASGSSDAPVESLSPLLGMWAAMVRGGYAPEEALSFDHALKLYTEGACSNGFDEVGSTLAEGSRANLTLLYSNVEGMHPAMLRKVEVAATIIEGLVGYSRTGVDSI